MRWCGISKVNRAGWISCKSGGIGVICQIERE